MLKGAADAVVAALKAALQHNVSTFTSTPDEEKDVAVGVALLQTCKVAVTTLPGEDMQKLLDTVESATSQCQQNHAEADLKALAGPIIEVAAGEPDAKNLPEGCLAKLAVGWYSAKPYMQSEGGELQASVAEIMKALDLLLGSALSWEFALEPARALISLLKG